MSKEFCGRLKHRVVIETLSDERTDDGLTTSSWRIAFASRACVIPDGFGPAVVGDSRSSMARMRFLMRSERRAGVCDRLRWAGRLFTINQICEDPQSPERVELRCEEVRP